MANATVVSYGDLNTGRGLSPGLWGDCRAWLTPQEFIVYYDDFLDCDTDIQAGNGPFFFADTNATFTPLATEIGGVMQMATSGTDNTGGVLTTGDNVAGMVKFTAGKNLWFEARVRCSSAAATNQGFFIGLTEEALAAADFMADDGSVLADKDYVGFRILEADADGLDAVFRTDGASAEIVVKNEAQVVALATWYKCGIRYDATDDRVYWYINGAPVSAQTSTASTTTDFPDGEELALTMAAKVNSTTTKLFDIDWWAVAMDN